MQMSMEKYRPAAITPTLQIRNLRQTLNRKRSTLAGRKSNDSQKPLGMTVFLSYRFVLILIDTAFRQQRLPAWRPILTPQNVIPILFAIGVFFIPLGVLFLISSAGVIISFVYCVRLNLNVDSRICI